MNSRALWLKACQTSNWNARAPLENPQSVTRTDDVIAPSLTCLPLQVTDYAIARRIVDLHSRQESSVERVYSLEDIQRYITFARQFKPKVGEQPSRGSGASDLHSECEQGGGDRLMCS